MENKIVNFFKFLEEKKNVKIPLKVKLANQDKFEFTEEDLYVDDDLHANIPKITTLPDNLTVTGLLNIEHSKITSLPKNLKVGSLIFVDDDKVDFFQKTYPQYEFV